MNENPYPQPTIDSVDLIGVLRALGDPVRLRIVVRLADNDYHSFKPEEYGLDLHKSTLSYHFKTLREAGITATLVAGRNHGLKLRRDDLEARFPGVLNSIISAATRADSAEDRDATVRTPTIGAPQTGKPHSGFERRDAGEHLPS